MPIVESGESSGPPKLLSIGELAELTGIAATALRYYDELGLVRPATRASGRRGYAASAVGEVGVIRCLREVGFSLAEIGSLLTASERRGFATRRAPWLASLASSLADMMNSRRAAALEVRSLAGGVIGIAKERVA